MMSTPTQLPDDHSQCCRDAHCGLPACPVVQAEARRQLARAGAWTALTPPTGKGSHASYHHLGGEPVTCSSVLELQDMDTRYDDYGSYSAYLGRGVLVRLEPSSPPKLFMLLGGHEWSTALAPWMRFRWPARGGR